MAAIALATLLTGCGGGGQGKSSSREGEGRTSASASVASATTATTAASATTSTTEAPTTTAPTPSGKASAGSYWAYAKLIKRLAGRAVVLPRGAVRLDPTLLECNGEGTALQVGPTRRWRRYTCTQTLFQGGVDQDVTFEVAIENAAQLRITSPRYGSD